MSLHYCDRLQEMAFLLDYFLQKDGHPGCETDRYTDDEHHYDRGHRQIAPVASTGVATAPP